jgi:hypothetical protein
MAVLEEAGHSIALLPEPEIHRQHPLLKAIMAERVTAEAIHSQAAAAAVQVPLAVLEEGAEALVELERHQLFQVLLLHTLAVVVVDHWELPVPGVVRLVVMAELLILPVQTQAPQTVAEAVVDLETLEQHYPEEMVPAGLLLLKFQTLVQQFFLVAFLRHQQ